MDLLTAHIGRPSRTPEQCRTAILLLLIAKPLMKWEVRQALHEPEGFIYKQLIWLRDDGKVRVVGRNLDRRAWALKDWVDPKDGTVLKAVERPHVVKRAVPPATSWWIAETREQFQAAQRQRAREAHWSGD